MRALQLVGYGEFSRGLRLTDGVDRPEVGPRDVLIKIYAASINPIDFKIALGQLRRILKLRLPAALGFDASGVVEAVGAEVREFGVGDPVFTRAPRQRMGSFAEYVAVHEDFVARKPAGLSHAEAASLPLVGLTTVQALVDRAHARPGQKILIHAGSGGVGSFAVQYAKRVLGLDVVATTSARNAGWVRDLGADAVLRYDRGETPAPGYDIVFDMLGGAALDEAFEALKPGGVVVSIAGPPDRRIADQLGAGWLARAVIWLMRRRVERLASRKRVEYYRFLTESDGRQLAGIGALAEAGVIRPVLDRVMPFDQILEAFQYAAQGRAKGKIVLEMVPSTPPTQP